MHKAAFTLAVLLVAGSHATGALQQQKGGEDETGPYEVVADWPKLSPTPGYIAGSTPAIFAETPDRVFIGIRGELKLPEKLPRGFNGTWGSMDQRATVPTAV